MTEADKRRFSAVMAMLGVAFDVVPTAQRIGIYFDALRADSIESLEWAAREAVKTLRFFPRAAELRDLAGIAPRPARMAVAGGQAVGMIEDLTPPEVARVRLAELAERLNGSFGTSFAVSEERGRPELVSAREEGL